MKTFEHRSIVTLLLAWVLTLAACHASSGGTSHHTHFILFLDLSASVPAAEGARWQGEIAKIAPDYGDAVSIFPICGQTGDAAPLLDMEIPPLDGDAGLEALARGRRIRRQVRDQLLERVRTAFEKPRFKGTDIFSAIDRIGSDSRGRSTVAIFFSDMLNTSRDKNLERPPALANAAMPDLIHTIAASHYWTGRSLQQVNVYCILNSVETVQKAPPNDRRVLHEFYRMLFEALGARLLLFDTHFGGNGVRP